MRTKPPRVGTSRLLGVLGVCFALLWSAKPSEALVNATAVDGLANSDVLRSGGSSAAFKVELVAALSQFKQVTRVFRMCGSGGQFASGTDACDGTPNGTLQDFVVIQGFFWDSTTQANGFGVPGGNGGVEGTVRVSANKGSDGPKCANTQSVPGNATTAGIGFLMPEGPDGVPNTYDDAGGAGTFGTNGAGAAPTTGFPQGAAPLTACSTNVLSFAPSTTTTTGALERCVVQVDTNNNGTIDGATAGNCTVAQGQAGTCPTPSETTNGKLTCDLGVSVIPPGDSDSSSVNGLTFNNQTSFGAAIFKFIASKDVHANSGTADKIGLFVPQVQNIFAPASTSSVCSWDALGAVATTGGSGATAFDLNVCYLDLGSATRATFVKTVMVATQGSKQLGQDTSIALGGGSGTGSQAPVCVQPGTAPSLHHKWFYQNATTTNESTCVGNHTASIGFVDGDWVPPTNTSGDTEWYNVPFEGVDPDTNVLKNAVSCGQYRFWSALTGGDGARCISVAGGSCSNPFLTAEKTALNTELLYNGTLTVHLDAYLPFGTGTTDGTAYTKGSNLTDGFFNLKYRPGTACQGHPAAPAPIPLP